VVTSPIYLAFFFHYYRVTLPAMSQQGAASFFSSWSFHKSYHHPSRPRSPDTLHAKSDAWACKDLASTKEAKYRLWYAYQSSSRTFFAHFRTQTLAEQERSFFFLRESRTTADKVKRSSARECQVRRKCVPLFYCSNLYLTSQQCQVLCTRIHLWNFDFI